MMYVDSFFKKSYGRIRGFTLLETMVAVTLLAVAIVAPMTLTAQSLASAYYARDEVTAFYMAQEGLEIVRNIRDNNILIDSQAAQGSGVNLLNGIPISSAFRVDARVTYTSANQPTLCSSDQGGVCTPLQTDGTLYGYGFCAIGGSCATPFTRTITACYVQPGGACNSTISDEVKVTVIVSWQTGSIQSRSVNLSENLYRWVDDGSATS